MPQVPEDDILFTPQELAEYLRLKVSTVYAWKARHTGPPFMGEGRIIRYRKGDVDKWLADQTRHPEQDAS